MLEVSLIQIIVLAFPEYFLLTYVSLNLLGIKTKVQNYFKVAVICTFILWGLRSVFSLYGVHTLVMIFILAVVIKLVVNIKLRIAVIASLIGFIILGVGETIIITLGINLWQLEMEVIVKDLISYLFSYAGKLPLFIIALGIHYYDWKLINIGGDAGEGK